jgi:type IV pilus assembly protein PilA
MLALLFKKIAGENVVSVENKAKFYLVNRILVSGNNGFTLVELLVVIVIIGILTAISIPSFLNQTAKAKQTEAKQNIAVVIRSQQLRYSEQSSFAPTFDELALGNLRGTTNSTATGFYIYDLAAGGGNMTRLMTITASTQDSNLKSYSGALAIQRAFTQESVWESMICVANTPGVVATTPTDANSCPASFRPMTVANP